MICSEIRKKLMWGVNYWWCEYYVNMILMNITKTTGM
jgi:hypothetical protein